MLGRKKSSSKGRNSRIKAPDAKVQRFNSSHFARVAKANSVPQTLPVLEQWMGTEEACVTKQGAWLPAGNRPWRERNPKQSFSPPLLGGDVCCVCMSCMCCMHVCVCLCVRATVHLSPNVAGPRRQQGAPWRSQALLLPCGVGLEKRPSKSPAKLAARAWEADVVCDYLPVCFGNCTWNDKEPWRHSVLSLKTFN